MPYAMDALVGGGVNFVDGYCAVPWCGPARASMLSGMYLHNHGCDTNKTHPAFVRRASTRTRWPPGWRTRAT